MKDHTEDTKALKLAKKLKNADNWKHLARWHGDGYYTLQTDDTGDVPVRIFLTPKLLKETEDIIYRQIVNATRFPGVKLVAITPDTHYGYGVPVGCVILTDSLTGAVAMGPVGYDIGCGMVSARSDVPAESATAAKKLAFNAAVNAERPPTLLRIFDLDRHPPDAVDFDRAAFAVLHRTEPLMIGATGEHVANFQRGDAGGPGDNFTN